MSLSVTVAICKFVCNVKKRRSVPFFLCGCLKSSDCLVVLQGHPTDGFSRISVRKTCNRLRFSVKEMSSRAFLINAFCFRRDNNDVVGTKIGQLGFSKRQ